MFGLFAPLLAQLITLNVGDRTEGRVIVGGLAGTGERMELETRPLAALRFGWRHSEATLGYTTSLLVTPIDSESRSLLVFHTGYLGAAYYTHRTRVSVSESVGYGQRNFAFDTLGETRTTTPGSVPTSPTGTPTTGTTGTPTTGTTGTSTGTSTGMTTGMPSTPQARALLGNIRYEAITTSLNISHELMPTMSLVGELAYTIAGGADTEARTTYPLVRGPRLSLSAMNKVTKVDRLTTLVSAQALSTPATDLTPYDTNGLLTQATETWEHRFDEQSTARLSGGTSLTRTAQSDGLTAWSIFPVFTSTITTIRQVGRNALTLGTGVGSTPVLDPLTATVDPRLSVLGLVGFHREPVTLTAEAVNVRSLGGGVDRARVNSFNGSMRAALRLGEAASLDAGFRMAWQTVGGETIVPPSWAAFVGATFTGLFRL